MPNFDLIPHPAITTLRYEDQTQNYDPEIHEDYLIHDTPFLLPHHLQPCADCSIAINTTNYSGVTKWGGGARVTPSRGDTRMKKIVAEFSKNSGQTRSDS